MSSLLSSLLNSGNLKLNHTNEGNCYLLSWFFFSLQRQLWFMIAASPVYATIVRGLDCCFHIRNVFRWKYCHSFCMNWWSCYVYLSAVNHLQCQVGRFSLGRCRFGDWGSGTVQRPEFLIKGGYQECCSLTSFLGVVGGWVFPFPLYGIFPMTC